MMNEGAYRARGRSLAFELFGANQTEGAAVDFVISEGEYKGRNLRWVGWLNEKNVKRTGESLTLCGYDGKDSSTINRQEVVIVVQHEDYPKSDGTMGKRETVRWVNDPNRGAQSTPMNAAETAAAKQRLASAMAAIKAAAPATKPKSDPDLEVKF